MAHLQLPGTTASATVPLAAAHQVTDGGAWELRVRMRPELLDAAVRYVVRTFTTAGTDGWGFLWNASQWSLFGGASGLVQLHDNGTMGDLLDADVWVRFTFDGNNNNRFYVSADDTNDPDEVDFGDPARTLDFETTWAAATLNPWRIGASGSSGQNQFHGRIYRVALYGDGSTPVFDADFSDPTTWASDLGSITEKANEATVTLQGDAELVGDPPPPFGSAQKQLLLGVG